MIPDRFSISIWLADIAIFAIAFMLGRWYEAHIYIHRLQDLEQEVKELNELIEEIIHDHTRPQA